MKGGSDRAGPAEAAGNSDISRRHCRHCQQALRMLDATTAVILMWGRAERLLDSTTEIVRTKATKVSPTLRVPRLSGARR